MMALMIVGLMAGSAAASDWEMTGGLAITETTLDVWNDVIDNLNDSFENGFDFPDGSGGTVTVMTENEEKAENIDRVPMLFLGARKDINEKWTGELRYEYIFGTVEGHTYLDSNANLYGFTPGEKQSAELDVKLHGITALADYQLNESWTVGGGVGIYNGTKTKKFEGAVFEAIHASGKKVTPKDEDFDLDAISYRLGVGYERAFAQNWDFNANLDYLYMEIDDEDDGNVYSKGFSYGLGVTYHF
jgi:hypothetical protein